MSRPRPAIPAHPPQSGMGAGHLRLKVFRSVTNTVGRATSVQGRAGAVGLRQQCGGPKAPASWRTPNALRIRRRRAGARQRMQCGGWPPLCAVARVEPGSAPSRCRWIEVKAGLRLGCSLLPPRGNQERSGPELEEGRCARETVPQQGGPSARAPAAEGRSECAAVAKEALDRRTVDANFREDPCPFPWTSQFRVPAWEEALLGLATCWRNRRRPLLFPAQPPCQGVQTLKCAGQAVVSGEQRP